MLPSHHVASRRSESMKRIERRGWACDDFSAPLDCSRSGVEDHIIECKEWGAKTRGLTSSQYSPDSCQEFNGCEWLRNVIISAGFKSTHLICHCSFCGQHNNRDATPTPDLMENTEPVFVR